MRGLGRSGWRGLVALTVLFSLAMSPGASISASSVPQSLPPSAVYAEEISEPEPTATPTYAPAAPTATPFPTRPPSTPEIDELRIVWELSRSGPKSGSPPAPEPTATPVPPTPTSTPVPPTPTPVPPTPTPLPPTRTPLPVVPTATKPPLPTATPVPPPAPAPVPQNVSVAAEETVLALINQDRQSRGLPPVTMYEPLRQVARAHAQDMAARNYFAHNTPEGLTPFDRMRAAGITFSNASENLGYSQYIADPVASLNAMHQAMMAEVAPNDGHLRNILNGSLRRVGIAVVMGPDQRVYFACEFIN